MIGRPRTDPIIRFQKFVDRTDTCWLWTGTTNRGYGQFWNGDGRTYAHRWAYEYYVGPIGQLLQIDHLCRVPSCVNPEHLEPVTPRENILRSDSITAVHARRQACDRHGPLQWTGNRRRCVGCAREANVRHRAKKAAA